MAHYIKNNNNIRAVTRMSGHAPETIHSKSLFKRTFLVMLLVMAVFLFAFSAAAVSDDASADGDPYQITLSMVTYSGSQTIPESDVWITNGSQTSGCTEVTGDVFKFPYLEGDCHLVYKGVQLPSVLNPTDATVKFYCFSIEGHSTTITIADGIIVQYPVLDGCWEFSTLSYIGDKTSLVVMTNGILGLAKVPDFDDTRYSPHNNKLNGVTQLRTPIINISVADYHAALIQID